jgi:HEAT repeat protein
MTASFAELAALAQDRRYGKARQMIVLGLGRSKRPEAVELLVGLVDDPDVDGHAVKALGRLRAAAAREVLESKCDDKRAWVRRGEEGAGPASMMSLIVQECAQILRLAGAARSWP